MKNPELSTDGNAQEVLLIGDTSGVFSNAGDIDLAGCEVHAGILDGIDAAARGRFATIAVVMSGLSGRLKPVLKALRQNNHGAKIILLAQVYEEPLAMQFVGSAGTGEIAADDYLICPVDFSRLVSNFSHPAGGTIIASVDKSVQDWLTAKEGAVAAGDIDTDEKIKRLEELATTDDLTGLKNRRYIREFARQIIERAGKENGRVTLLVFDIDDFKHYNDVYGHLAGDEILKQVGILMRRCCRRHDVVGRIGGDEFAFVFWDDPRRKMSAAERERRSTRSDHPKEAICIANRFRDALNKAELHLLGPEGKGVLTISGGLASFPRDGLAMEKLFEQADEALLDAKRSGKNRIYLVGTPQSDIADIK